MSSIQPSNSPLLVLCVCSVSCLQLSFICQKLLFFCSRQLQINGITTRKSHLHVYGLLINIKNIYNKQSSKSSRVRVWEETNKKLKWKCQAKRLFRCLHMSRVLRKRRESCDSDSLCVTTDINWTLLGTWERYCEQHLYKLDDVDSQSKMKRWVWDQNIRPHFVLSLISKTRLAIFISLLNFSWLVWFLVLSSVVSRSSSMDGLTCEWTCCRYFGMWWRWENFASSLIIEFVSKLDFSPFSFSATKMNLRCQFLWHKQWEMKHHLC